MAESLEISVLSNFGVRYFLEDVSTIITSGHIATSAATSAANEIKYVLSCNVGEINKDVKTFKTLNGNGWDSAVPLGQSISEGSMNLIRVGSDIFNGTDDDNYGKLKKWVLDATKAGGATAAKALVEIVPRGMTSGSTPEEQYEATVYVVVPTKFNPGERNTDDGQEFDISFQPYGAPIPCTVTKGSSDGVFNLTEVTLS